MAQEIIQHHSFFDYYACWGRKTLCATEYHHQDVVESMLHATRRYSVVPSTKSASSSSQSRKRTHSDTMVSPNEKPSVLSIITIDPENHEETKGSVIQWDEDTIELGPENLNDISQFADGYD
ncbi:uncharacterized protein B0P05DRAFT_554814, partial [Gilbertella persicaria]|uniref:uncharacterized protein n=1 Tax=Gilbertella persicaria TaxID=101096 RepID=UPI00222101EB